MRPVIREKPSGQQGLPRRSEDTAAERKILPEAAGPMRSIRQTQILFTNRFSEHA